jgi:alkylation response protein AidB-like acyl-CoA dehydrogenase
MRLDGFGEFMAEHVYPNETALAGPGAEDELRELRDRAKQAGLWAPNLPRELGGMGLSFLDNTLVNEVIGRSLFGPEVFGAQAPDSGNAELLQLYGTAEQRDRWLKPSAAGEIWSAFSMTEPDVSGSDPTGIRTRARLDGDSWVIDGHKWFTSGGSRASFAIVMCVTEPDADPHRRASMIIVPADTPGFTVVRDVPVMGTTSGAHSEIRYESCRVPVSNLLGERGAGFLLAQRRLGPGRIQHTMRWLGQMQRAFDLMCERALGRTTRGKRLADLQTVQEWIATAAADIQAARLLTMRAAHAIDAGRDARTEISMIKFWGARVLVDVIDKAIQVHGALGVSGDTPLELMYRRARAARIYDGVDEVHKQVVARGVLRQFEAGRPWSFA